MTSGHEMPEDPSRDPEEAVDAMEEELFGTTMDQVREDETPDPDRSRPASGSADSPTTTESPA